MVPIFSEILKVSSFSRNDESGFNADGGFDAISYSIA